MKHRYIGDGDDCPVVPSHRAMLVIPGTQKQYCPDQSHDGVWTPDGKRPATRSFWPTGYRSFAAEVKAYNEGTAGEAAALPDIDMEAFNA